MSADKKRPNSIFIFPSDLGWIGFIAANETVIRLTFGHPSVVAVKKALELPNDSQIDQGSISNKKDRMGHLVARLQAYASGQRDNFRDIQVDPRYFRPAISHFQLRVLEQCRKIPPGCTITYAELAAKAGSPNAARAVGNCMAANHIPLIIPCHRVVRTNGEIGRFSAPGGVLMKRRLLALESIKLA